jgi:archaemetzincin
MRAFPAAFSDSQPRPLALHKPVHNHSMRLGFLLFALTVLVPNVGWAESLVTGGKMRILYVQPLGACRQEQAGGGAVRRALLAFYDLEIRFLPCVELPAEAYYQPRRRYRAEKLLRFLDKRLPADGWRILGLTATDISTSKGAYVDWGVLGLGEMPGKASVISSFRCKKKARDSHHATIRLAKVAVHEVGHTLGLPHCPNLGCLMEDALGKVATVDREHDFCTRCRKMAASAGVPIKAPAVPPW